MSEQSLNKKPLKSVAHFTQGVKEILKTYKTIRSFCDESLQTDEGRIVFSIHVRKHDWLTNQDKIYLDLKKLQATITVNYDEQAQRLVFTIARALIVK